MAPMAIDGITSAVTSSDPIAALKTALNGKPDSFHQTLDGLDANPLRRTWRGNKQDTIRLQQAMPDFGEDLYAKRQWVKEHMAGAFQFWGKRGYGEGLSGHITVRDPVLPDHYWMNPICVHFSNITVDNLVLVTPEGWVSEHGAQLPINSSGFLIHSAVHRARPEVQAAAHCHSIHGKAWSVFGKKIDMLAQDSCLFYENVGVYSNFGGLVLAKEEGENIAKAMGSKYKTCILQNHGMLTVGSTVDEAAYYLSALENQCRAQLLVEAASANKSLTRELISDEDAAFSAATLQNPENVYVNFQVEYDLLVREAGDFFLCRKK